MAENARWDSLMTLVRYEEDGLIVRIILNRPQKLNAFNQDIILELTQALSKAEKSMARMVVFQGNGKGFSGGFDLSDIKTSSDGELVLRFIQVEKFLQAVYHCPLATVAFVHGACFGAAADLVAACHWRIATSDAQFMMPGPKFGLVLGTRRLSVLVGEDNARQLLLRDKPFEAPDALRTNFISQIKEYDEWMDVEKKIFSQVKQTDVKTYAELAWQKRSDHRDSDMMALVRSASASSVQSRIQTYLDKVQEHKNNRKLFQ